MKTKKPSCSAKATQDKRKEGDASCGKKNHSQSIRSQSASTAAPTVQPAGAADILIWDTAARRDAYFDAFQILSGSAASGNRSHIKRQGEILPARADEMAGSSALPAQNNLSVVPSQAEAVSRFVTEKSHSKARGSVTPTRAVMGAAILTRGGTQNLTKQQSTQRRNDIQEAWKRP